MTYNNIVAQQQAYYLSGATRSVAFRRTQLQRLEAVLRAHEQEIYDAIHADMHRAPVETFLLEIGPLYDDLHYALRHLAAWAAPARAWTPPLLWPGTSSIYPEPRGVAMIISAWNFPFTQLFIPLVGAIAAGCAAILRPSEMSPASSRVAARIVAAAFAPEYVTVLEGGREVTEALFAHPLDFVFFTGSPRVGSIILGHAAPQLIPVVLELGGKSPAIVAADANLRLAARRIAWSKFFNAGQLCTTTDHVYVHETVVEPFLTQLAEVVREFYGEDPRMSPDYARILTSAHAERLSGLLDGVRVRVGGVVDMQDRYIAPTVVDSVTESHPLMQEEIFGPILPVLPFATIQEVVGRIVQRPKPLACSIFSTSSTTIEHVVDRVAAGGITINDTMLHAGSTYLPFGGIGQSGMGAYHGKYTFDAFTHYKPVFRRVTPIDVPLRYPPYAGKLSWLARITRWTR